MADIASSFVKMTDIEIAEAQPDSTALNTKIGANINAFIDFYNLGNSQVFTSSGSFTVPENVTSVVVLGCGGGGGGSGGQHLAVSDVCANGGAGGEFYIAHVQVTPAASISVTRGNGGAGGAGQSAGSDGQDSAFGSLIFKGGKGGTLTAAPEAVQTLVKKGGFSGDGGAGALTTNTAASAGESTIYGDGGAGGIAAGTTLRSGGGGGAAIGDGGGGSSNSNGLAANDFTGGGGGAGAAQTIGTPQSFSGGNGGAGLIVVTW